MNRLLTHFMCLVSLFFSLVSGTQAQSKYTVSGRTCDSVGNPIEYSTVLLMAAEDTSKVFGKAADLNGRFEISVPAGNYKLKASFLGYEDAVKEITLTRNQDIGDLVLGNSSVNIDAIMVTAEFITREADRFVVNVENSPMAIGQTATDMLELSPGVWVDERTGISINGKSNPQIMINDRIVRETGEDLINYLNSIKAEDIKRIEIIPVAGVDQEASAQSGMIKITLKRQRENGLEGSVTMRYGTGFRKDDMEYIQPSFNLNYKINKISLYTTVGENINKGHYGNESESFYTSGTQLNSKANTKYRGHTPNVRLGAIYEINDRHSIGVEGNYTNYYYRGPSELVQRQTLNAAVTDVNSIYRNKNRSEPYTLTANYIAKLDTVGSTFKFIFDMNRSQSTRNQDYENYYRGAIQKDSIYKNHTVATNRLYSFSGDFDIKSGEVARIKAGVKYTYSEVKNDMAYDFWESDIWHPITEMTYINSYTENIAALYGSYAITFKNKMSINAGLRGEYTYASPENNSIRNIDKQNYFGLFPNVNFSTPVGKKSNHMLILTYSRKIQRPPFSYLIPRRETINEFAYYEGNPKLEPAYANDYSLSWVIARKYNITAGAQTVNGAISQLSKTNTNDPSTIIYYPDNTDNYVNGYLQVNLPLELTKWWRMNSNLTGSYTNNKVEGENYDIFSFRGNIGNVFTAYKDLLFNFNVYYMSPNRYGYFKMEHYYYFNAGVRYSWGKDKRYTGNVYVNNFTNNHTRTQTANTPEHTTTTKYFMNFRRLGIAFRYNFKSGKEFKVKNIESGASEQSYRMGSSGGDQQ